MGLSCARIPGSLFFFLREGPLDLACLVARRCLGLLFFFSWKGLNVLACFLACCQSRQPRKLGGGTVCTGRPCAVVTHPAIVSGASSGRSETVTWPVYLNMLYTKRKCNYNVWTRLMWSNEKCVSVVNFVKLVKFYQNFLKIYQTFSNSLKRSNCVWKPKVDQMLAKIFQHFERLIYWKMFINVGRFVSKRLSTLREILRLERCRSP